MELLLKNMEDVPREKRGARFCCVIVIARPGDPTPAAQAEGFVAGMIQYDAQGDNGFGYDPVFYLPEYDQTAAQLSSDVKNRISHRAKAAETAVEALNKLTADNC